MEERNILDEAKKEMLKSFEKRLDDPSFMFTTKNYIQEMFDAHNEKQDNLMDDRHKDLKELIQAYFSNVNLQLSAMRKIADNALTSAKTAKKIANKNKFSLFRISSIAGVVGAAAVFVIALIKDIPFISVLK